MAAIAPFRALRYNLTAVRDLSLVVAPPYDVITPPQREQLAARSPHNIVHLELPQDRPPLDRYAAARETFQAWRRDGVLAQDADPALYLYEHAFEWQGASHRRLGVVGALELTDDSLAQMLRHEATFEGPKADRLKLLDAVQANLSPVFCVAPDPSRRFAQALAAGRAAHASDATATVGEGETARVWVVRDPARIDAIRQALAPATLLIADGHHRFAVAVSRRAQFGTVMCYVAAMDDPAVVMRPIHRVVKIPEERRRDWRATLERLCAFEPAASVPELMAWLDREDAQGRFGYYAHGRCWKASLREPVLHAWLLNPTTPMALAGLDVTLLHHLLLPQAAGDAAQVDAGSGQSASGGNRLCDYTAEPADAAAMADRLGEAGCAWLLRPIPLAQVFALASQGVTVAHKTTFFHPKLLSGLFLHSVEPAQ